jgi:hypothetical protein
MPESATLIHGIASFVGVLIGFSISLAVEERRHRKQMKQLDEYCKKLMNGILP